MDYIDLSYYDRVTPHRQGSWIFLALSLVVLLAFVGFMVSHIFYSERCWHCDGTGNVQQIVSKGQTVNEPCNFCYGTGRRKQAEPSR
ncbi:hypothetical protein BH11PLA2_BH11PLA2_39260 [soil metagenome]